MNYPKIKLEHSGFTRIGRNFTQMLKKSYPGGFSDDSDIVLRWGQNTTLDPNKKTVIFDCGYFHRNHSDGENRHFRLSINEYHPTNLPPEKGDRWDRLRIRTEDFYDPSGHVLLIGRGGKTKKQQGKESADWEQRTVKKIQSLLPSKKIIYRPKKNPSDTLEGTITDGESGIKKLCMGCSLIYTQWSNVGNEGILYGVPVVTEGGPASDVCPSRIEDSNGPLSNETRMDFLHRLAYWQWSIKEIKEGAMWPWLMRQIETA